MVLEKGCTDYLLTLSGLSITYGRGDAMIGFIGAGKVGFSLGKWFATENVHVTGYFSRHIESAKEAAEFTGSSVFYDLKTLVEESNIIIITVPDGEIAQVYKELADFDLYEKQICHCSGSLSAAEVFTDLSKKGAYGYSIHPLFPVNSKYESYKELRDAFFCIEGDEKHLPEWKERLTNMGAKVRVIAAEDKVKYHAACAISSNLVCGLVGESLRLLTQCGFLPDEAMDALKPLVLANMKKILEVSPAQALTGPLERGDVETIQKHLACFETDIEKEMYRTLSLLLLREAQDKHPKRDYSEIKKNLGGNDI